MTDWITGSQALAGGAWEAGVQFVTGYPGSPATSVLEDLAALPQARDVMRVEWAINEKAAMDAAVGASLAGVRTLVCLKNVGLNVALDSLMVANLAGGPGALVVLVGDDPGGWGSQNEEDSRPLAAAAEVPLVEPTSPSAARPVMRHAFALSEQFQVPVVVRITRALAAARLLDPIPLCRPPAPRSPSFQRQPERWNVLPIRVVPLHRELQATLARVEATFESSPFNHVDRPPAGPRQGIVAAGGAYDKLRGLLIPHPDGGEEQESRAPVPVLALGTLHPLPEQMLLGFMRAVDEVLVVEETAPMVETQLQALAQRAGLGVRLLGRSSGHLPAAGELLASEIGAALASFLPGDRHGAAWPGAEQGSRPMISRQPLCEGCPYIPTMDALTAVMARHGGREAFIVTGETGCMVRAQLPPWQILDVKYGMGASIGLAAGLARWGLPERIVALSGDSALLHSGLGELIDASQANIDLLLVVLDNGTTALSGGQPHPATAHDVFGRPRPALALAPLLEAAGAHPVRVVDPDDRQATEAALEECLATGGVAAVIVRHPCPRWQTKTDES